MIRVRASQIFTHSMEDVVAAKKLLDSGTSFEEAVEKYSTCPSKKNGGDLGWMPEGNLQSIMGQEISEQKLESINQRTRDGGAEIVKFLEKGSAFYAPAASGIEMAEAFLKDQKKLLPCAVHLHGEYGINNVYAGVPVIIGKEGVERIDEIDLNDPYYKLYYGSAIGLRARVSMGKKEWLKTLYHSYRGFSTIENGEAIDSADNV